MSDREIEKLINRVVYGFMECPDCGELLEPDELFCGRCGWENNQDGDYDD